MKRISSIINLSVLVFFWVTACNQKQELTQVTVTIQNNPQNQIVSLISKEYGTSPVVMDTATIDAGTGSTHFEVAAAAKGIYSIKFEKDGRYILFINDKSVIDINADWNDFSAYSASSPATVSLRSLLITFNNYLTAIDTLKRNGMQSETDSLRNGWMQAEQKRTDEAQGYLLHYTDTTQSPVLALYALGILQQKQPDAAVIQPVVSRLAIRFSGNEEVEKATEAYTTFLVKQNRRLTVGKTAPGFSLPDITGQPVSLQSFRGRYTLVDFWASWCGPCRQENPALVAAFNAFKDKNFTILGVSLDKDKNSWLNAIHKDGLTWQQVSDLKEWESVVVPLYNIEGIPFNVLLDPEGKIISMNLRGVALEQKLAEVLGGAP